VLAAVGCGKLLRLCRNFWLTHLVLESPMKKLLKWSSWLLLTLVLLAGLAFVQVWYFKPVTINLFYGKVFAKFGLRSPEMLSYMRILPSWMDFYSDDLADASLAEEEIGAQMVKENLDTLRRYDRSGLDREAQLSYDVLENFLANQVAGDAFRGYEFPVNQMQGIQSGLPSFMTDAHQVNNVGDARNYIARLDKFPRKFSQVIEGLDHYQAKGIVPPQFTVEKVIKQMQDFRALPAQENTLYVSFKEKLDKLDAKQVDDATRANLLAGVEASIKDHVYPAYQQLIDHFTALLPKAQGNYGAWHLPNGDAYYAWCIRNHTTTDLSAEQIHQIGLTEVARIGAEMDAILRDQGLSEGSIGDRVRQITADPAQLYSDDDAGRKAIIADYQHILDEVNQGLGGAFDIRPKLGVEVRAVPKFSEATAPGAYYSGGAFDGSRPGVFYANLRDVRETPRLGMRTLSYHEGIPGHHFQISIAQELKGVPFFRRVLPFTAYAEGWALYAERLAWELGFEKDPLDNLGRLIGEMMRAVRLVVDTGIHAKHWTREQAIDYMLANTGMGETEVIAEIERYFVNPGQALAYKIGMLKILELRERARSALGDKFDLKAFHNQVLSHGSLPLNLLERVIDDWIAEQK
jgi:uncharacterized protein (DUF885 family)